MQWMAQQLQQPIQASGAAAEPHMISPRSACCLKVYTLSVQLTVVQWMVQQQQQTRAGAASTVPHVLGRCPCVLLVDLVALDQPV
jgi:hypothetical protein